MTAILVLLPVAAALLGLTLALVALRRTRRPPERLEECTCGAVMPVARAHLVSAAYDDEDTGGGTAITAAFCRAHCPGGCNHPKEHR